jgi:serine phosphatase RsbU (regulator of sigma subunit)
VVAGFAIAGGSHPARETGGDYFDFIPLPDGSLGIAVGDASGHGIGAALGVVRAHRGDVPGEIIAALLRAARAFSPEAPTDDMTAVVIKVGSN